MTKIAGAASIQRIRQKEAGVGERLAWPPSGAKRES
jgi:hypothetical protein